MKNRYPRSGSGLHFREYARALRERHPEMLETHGPLLESLDIEPTDDPDRFQKPTEKQGCGGAAAWNLARLSDIPGARGEPKPFGVSKSYRGLLLLKPPFDLVLYADLIWQSQPRTIIEFGSGQGGSGLWFADQAQVLAPGCDVLSFDRFSDCVSPRAKHPRLHFHTADLTRLETLDPAQLAALPHPWVVIEDAHVNVFELFTYVDRFMVSGDYYIVEDWTMQASARELHAIAELFEGSGYMVDVRYTDAFGMNMTSAAHGWMRKS